MVPSEDRRRDKDLSPLEVFCSYAHKDEPLRRQLEQHLSLLSQQGIATLWHDRLIAPGTDWSQEVDTHLETAPLVLLLISSDFLASDYCYGIEMKRALFPSCCVLVTGRERLLRRCRYSHVVPNRLRSGAIEIQPGQRWSSAFARYSKSGRGLWCLSHVPMNPRTGMSLSHEILSLLGARNC